MQESNTITIFGEPVGKGRPRFARTGAYVRAYTPDKTRQYEENVAMIYRLRKGQYFGAEPVTLKVDAYFAVPKSASKKAREAMLSGETPCMKKPDADNIIKCIADALNGVAYDDDKQITRGLLLQAVQRLPARGDQRHKPRGESMKEVTLKPCPFCGHEAKAKGLIKGKCRRVAYVQCCVCDARSTVYEGEVNAAYADLAREAAAAWNRREGG